MKDASTWAQQAIDDLVDAARAKGTDLEASILERFERRIREVQLDALRAALGECKLVAQTRPRFEAAGAHRCASAIADLSLRINANKQVPADA